MNLNHEKTPVTGLAASGGFRNSMMIMIHVTASVKRHYNGG